MASRTRVIRAGLFGAVALAALVASADAQPAAPAAASAPPGARPAGWSDQSYYLPMRDGVKLAVSLWFPGGAPPADRSAPVLLIQTRYGRNGIYGHNESGRYEDFRKAGYVVAVLDTRGSTSSFGPRDTEMGPDEIRDMDEIIRHFQTRPWANGQVVAAGVSYMADTADFAAASPARLTATIVRESDFDIYRDLITPGGVANDFMMNAWSEETLRRDTGRHPDPSVTLDCAARVEDCPGLFPRLQPVDGDEGYVQMREAFKGRHRWTAEDYKDADFRDDRGRNGYRLFDSSPASRLAGIRREKVPTLYWGSWMDAGTADAALARYRGADQVPTRVIITANNHGGEQSTDPFFPGEAPPLPSFDDQVSTMLDFAAKARTGAPIGRGVRYYVLGARAFRDTPVWPPAGVTMRRYPLAAQGALATAGAKVAAGVDRYAVDFTASTGAATRWSTQIGTPAAYPDRRAADAKLIAYTSAPLTQDMELVGNPSIDLFLAAETKDPAIFVYLEDVAPDGRVTYITEGQLRAVHRKLAAPASLPYPLDPPAHSFNRADALPVTPGQVFEANIALFPVAARIRKGHALRVAIAGADADTFRRYSAGSADAFTIHRGGARASAVNIPLRPWK